MIPMIYILAFLACQIHLEVGAVEEAVEAEEASEVDQDLTPWETHSAAVAEVRLVVASVEAASAEEVASSLELKIV